MKTSSTASIQPDRFGALNSLPTGYKLAQRLGLESRRTFILLNAASAVPMIVGALFFFGVDRLLYAVNVQPAFDKVIDNTNNVGFAILCVVLVILLLSFHELCHGLAFQAFGAHPQYGVNLRKAVAYARADTYYLTRDAYIVVALAPLVVITILTLIGMLFTGGGLRFMVALMGASNAGGAIGDLWFTAVCLRYSRDTLVRDFGDGAELFTHSSEAN